MSASYLNDPDTDDEAPTPSGGLPADPEAQRVATDQAAALKGLGNEAFGAKDYQGALEHYSAAIKLLKEAEQSESNLDYAQGGNLQTIYTMK